MRTLLFADYDKNGFFVRWFNDRQQRSIMVCYFEHEYSLYACKPSKHYPITRKHN